MATIDALIQPRQRLPMKTGSPRLPGTDSPSHGHPGSVVEVAAAFLKLGISSFGGPVAHLGYFHREFVQRRLWLDEAQYGQLMALCQFLPGPASRQLGFVLGLMRAGWLGALTAFLAFTLPSALFLLAFAAAGSYLANPWGRAAIHGLKLVAVVVVAHAVLTMARTLTPDRTRFCMAAAAATITLLAGSAWIQVVLVIGGAALGPWLCRNVTTTNGAPVAIGYSRRAGLVLLSLFGVLLVIALTPWPSAPPLGQVASAFYRTGALVFGGGHVVLPLLQQAVVDPGWLDNDTFLAGYGAAQVVPGPMFTLLAFLGARMLNEEYGLLGAATSLIAIFLPGLLLVAGALPFWRALGARKDALRMMAGVNAVVVGLLAAALYNPVWISTIRDLKDFAIALAAFALLVLARWSALAVVIFCVTCSILLATHLRV